MKNSKNKKFNVLWRETLQSFAYKESLDNFLIESNSNNLESPYRRGDLLNTKVSKLDYNLSSSYYPESFIEELEKILKDFSNKTQYERRVAQEQLMMLVQDESAWRGLTKKISHQAETLKEMFPNQRVVFIRLSNNYLSPAESDLSETQRAYQNYFPYKFDKFIKGFLNILITKGNLTVLKGLEDLLTPENLRTIKENHINAGWIFTDMVRVIMKKAHDNLYNKSTRESPRLFNLQFREDSLVVNKNSVFYEYRRVLSMYLITGVLTYVCENKLHPIENLEETLNLIRNFLWRKRYLYDVGSELWWNKEMTQITGSFLHILENCGLFLEISNEEMRSRKQNKLKYVLPSQLEDMVHTITELPRVFIPNSVSDTDIDNNLIPSLFGENKVSKNTSLKNVLSLGQRKRFVVNETFVLILELLVNSTTNPTLLNPFLEEFSEQLDLPFSLEHEILKANFEYIEFESLNKKDPIQQCLFDELYSYMIGHNTKNVFLDDLREISGSSQFDIDFERVATEKLASLVKQEHSRKKAISIIQIAKMFKGIPLYITNNFCVRIRIYPIQSLLSRTSGQFKQILCDYTPKKVTLQGFIELLRCYYISSSSEECLNRFETFIQNTQLSKKKGMEKLNNFFDSNPIDFTKSKVFLYSSILHAEILKVKKTKKTAINVEIDQVASVLQFFALFFRNRKLAQVSNLLGGEFSCPYTFMMNYFKDDFSKNRMIEDLEFENLEFSEEAYSMLCTDRKLYKYAAMCFGYGQKTQGRVEDFIDRLYTLYPEEIDEKAEEMLKYFARTYLDFFDEVFPGITKQLNILKEVVKIVVKETGEMSIYNINGDKMSWSRYQHVTVERNVFNPITKKQVNISIESFKKNRRNGDIKEDDIMEHTQIIISYIIHSMDASVIHRVTSKVYEESSYIINSLHDCGLMHPNYVTDFYKVLEDLFKSGELYNSASNCFFAAAKNQVSPNSKPKIEKLERKFLELCDDFYDELNNINIRNCYKGEK